jgi:hypothetical protein
MKSIDMEFQQAKIDSTSGEDERHPPDGGSPGYRLVYKTLGLVPDKRLEINSKSANLKIFFAIREIDLGGHVVDGTLVGRTPNTLVLPGFLRLTPGKNDESTVTPIPNLEVNISGANKHFERASYIEFLLKTDSSVPIEILNEGRSKLARFKVMLDLIIGRQLLGTPIAEEVGRIFDDWHWVHHISTPAVILESTKPIQKIPITELRDRLSAAISFQEDLTDDDLRRLKLAAEWYWKSDHEPDPVNQFIQLWISIEATEMPDSTNITPVKNRLATITETDYALWDSPVGRLCGLRGRLVHGNAHAVRPMQLRAMKIICLTLLEARICPSESSELKSELVRIIKNAKDWI